jgi:glycosyltransferase involved in cell wall biosynthesis
LSVTGGSDREAPVSVVVPVLNERLHIEGLVKALLAQTRIPDEIVIADGGSTDGTREILEELAAIEPRLRVVDGPGGIAENRNAAIRAATHDIIACTDAGCLPEPQWLEELTRPFRLGADFVPGMYRPEGPNLKSTVAGLVLMSVPGEFDPREFVPGGSSQAFTKSAWEAVGGFPEGLPAGEDTLFGLALREGGFIGIFAPEAVVRWQPPATLREMWRKAYRWGKVDGAGRVNTLSYGRVALAYWGMLVLVVIAFVWRWWAGLLALALYGLEAAWRTRFKFRWAHGAGKYLLVPFAHISQHLVHTLGWAIGYGPGRVVKTGWRYLLLRLRRRREVGSPPVRHNVDLVPESDQASWLARLPDTYRVLSPAAAAGLDAPEVKGNVYPDPPGEPRVVPVAVSLPPVVLGEVGGDPGDVQARYQLLRQSGRRYVLREVSTMSGSTRRHDPIAGSGSVVILAGVPLHDVGGGSRFAQLALAFARHGYHVSYLHRFDAGESVDLGLRFIHPRLEEKRWREFDLDELGGRLLTARRLVMVEFPHPDMVEPVHTLKELGYRVVYDMVDDWSDPALGWWGGQKSESAVVELAELLTASAPALVARLRALSGREVAEIPNAVNDRVFTQGKSFDRPTDLPPGKGPLFLYHGSLYGAWLDWEAITRVAASYPHARVVLIGDPARAPSMPANVSFLGLKPQQALPAYLAHADLGLIPFRVNPTTHAVSPLKVYEYMAMGLPVAAPPLQSLVGLEGVYTATDLVAAVAAALSGPGPDPQRAVREHGWEQRLGLLHQLLGWELPAAGREVKVVARPVVHYPPSSRRLS